MKPELLDRYLNILGVKSRKPGIEALSGLVKAQLMRVPFENISKLYYKKHAIYQGLPGLELYLDGIENFHFGGTCYANNYYFYQLLGSLGYQIKLCGADMMEPDVHLVSIVSTGQREFLIDVGYAAPFLNPLPRDLKTDYIIKLGRDQYVLRPQDERGYSKLEHFRNGILRHGYSVNPAPRQIQEFNQAISDSYLEDSTFMNTILLARFYPDRSTVIQNLTMIESHGMVSTSQDLTGRNEFVQAASEYFSIPKKFTMDVVNDFGQIFEIS